MTDKGRRRVLGAVGAGVLGGLAGCTGLLDDDGPADETDQDDDPNDDQDDENDGSNVPGGAEADWPLVGRTPRNRLFDAGGPGASGDLSVGWTYEYEAPDSAELAVFKYSGPVLAGGVVYATVVGYYEESTRASTETEPVTVREVVGLDAASGEQVTTLPIDAGGDRPIQNPWSPVVAGGRLYYGGFALHGFDLAAGEQTWNRSDLIVTGQVTAVDDTVFAPTFGDSGTDLVAVDAADGTDRWRSDEFRNVVQPPAVTSDTVYLPDGPELVALDRSNGEARWRANAGVESRVLRPGEADATPVTPPVVGDGTLFVAGGFRSVLSRDAGQLAAVDPDSGEVDWTFQPETADADGYALVGGLPALHDGTLYVTGIRDPQGRGGGSQPELYAVDAADGRLEWTTETSSMALYTVGAGDSVLVANDGGVTAYATADGSERASTTEGNGLGVRSRAVSDGRLFGATTRGLVAHDFG